MCQFTRPCSLAAQAQREAEEEHHKAELRRKLAITQLPEVSSSYGRRRGGRGEDPFVIYCESNGHV